MKKLFTGIGVALVTPFKNNKIDFVSLRKLINHCLDNKASAIIVLATTGEGSTINPDERTIIIKTAKTVIKNRAKLIVGTGNNNLETCLNLTNQAKELGADGALVVTPYYNKTTQQGLIKYYEEIAKIGLPIIIYNVPARTGLNIELETIEEIIKTNKMVIGIKESSTDISRIIKLHQICRDKIAIYSGEDNLNFLFYCLGASGTISVTANVFPNLVFDLFNEVKNNSLKSARLLSEKLSTIDNALFIETNPIPIKFVLKSLGFISSSFVRPPLISLQHKNKLKLNKILKDYKSL